MNSDTTFEQLVLQRLATLETWAQRVATRGEITDLDAPVVPGSLPMESVRALMPTIDSIIEHLHQMAAAINTLSAQVRQVEGRHAAAVVVENHPNRTVVRRRVERDELGRVAAVIDEGEVVDG